MTTDSRNQMQKVIGKTGNEKLTKINSLSRVTWKTCSAKIHKQQLQIFISFDLISLRCIRFVFVNALIYCELQQLEIYLLVVRELLQLCHSLFSIFAF